MGDRPLRLCVSAAAEVGAVVDLGAAAVRHARVMRLRLGDAVELFDGQGWVAEAVVMHLERSQMSCEVCSVERHPKPSRRLSMWLGVAKAEKPDLAVRMLTELGVAQVCLVTCARSVVKGGASAERTARLLTIAQEACAQSGNPFLPQIVGPLSLLEALSLYPLAGEQQGVVLHERGQTSLEQAALVGKNTIGVVGPEGGFTEEELKMMKTRGFVVVRMAGPILRAETAAVVAATRLLDRM